MKFWKLFIDRFVFLFICLFGAGYKVRAAMVEGEKREFKN